MTNELWSDGSANTNSIVVNTAGTYTVGVLNACGTPTASINIQTNTTPTLNLNSSSLILCPNETATLTVIGGSTPYAWSNSSSTGSVVTTNGGTVTVSSTNACATSTASVNVTVVNLNASISANPMSGITPVTVDFTNNSVGANTYLWNFGNGQTASTQTVSSQTYSVVGMHTVYLLITNGSCSDIDSLTINVLNQEGTMVIPNVFTPNGDSINDIFRITGFNIVDFNCTIFDRWGLRMFAWDGIKNGWDGKSNDKDVPAGTYFYIINAKDIDGNDTKKQGAFSLFR
jgi:gliding motility-associated-like protein